MAWERRFEAAGVRFTPIQDMAFGRHLDFRDPDGIPLEFMVANAALTAGYARLREGNLTREEINAYVREHVLASGVQEADLPESLRPAPAGGASLRP